MSKSELEKHYLDTTYSVFINKERYDIKIGKTLPPVIQNLVNKENSAVILTAWNPQSQNFSLEDNKKRNKQLLVSIKENNYSIYDAFGQGKDRTWPAEESFFIPGIKEEEAEKLAIDYGQYAYVWLEYEKPASLVFTSIWYE